MIDEIQVRNLALIREATLEPTSGLTVLTGETGAGKTALISALKLLMGARASADMVRDGENELQVSGRFFNGDEPSDGQSDELVATRRVGADGRSRATLNGSMASMRELAALVAPSVDLCGQFEHQQLMRPATHLGILDAWADDEIAPALQSYRTAFEASTRAARELAQIREAGELSSAKLDEARFDLRRIDEVAPEEGEYETLKRDLSLAEHAESLVSSAATAYEAISGEGGALDGLNAAASALEAGGRFDTDLSALAASLRDAGFVLEDVAATARDYRDAIEFDPEKLAYQQERFSQLQGLLRAYGPRMEDVMARRDNAAEIVSLVDDSQARTRAAQRALDEAEAALVAAAEELDRARENAAPRFSHEVSAIMARLEMGGAELVCRQTRLNRESWTANGPSAFEFLYRPAPGMQARPLARIASGGEVSRVMLAAKVVLGAHDDVDTLVFDEVDAGVGGAVAIALADVLADLACTHQVIVVTHLAQVAVRGQTHYVVRRIEGETGTETQLASVTGADRELEIARMLSGDSTEASLAHARELIDTATRQAGT
uniref:DNA repair protein RecN n=1 Tax=uncultured bacterium Contigcl_1769 TaxID=1393659 RepID=W0FSM8_9BACT|nr:DNA repair ATPase [uncultured bacterium Contigcl_1769]